MADTQPDPEPSGDDDEDLAIVVVAKRDTAFQMDTSGALHESDHDYRDIELLSKREDFPNGPGGSGKVADDCFYHGPPIWKQSCGPVGRKAEKDFQRQLEEAQYLFQSACSTEELWAKSPQYCCGLSRDVSKYESALNSQRNYLAMCRDETEDKEPQSWWDWFWDWS